MGYNINTAVHKMGIVLPIYQTYNTVLDFKLYFHSLNSFVKTFKQNNNDKHQRTIKHNKQSLLRKNKSLYFVKL